MLGYISMFRLGHLSKVRAEQSRPPLPLLTYRITPILSKRMGWEKKFHGKICIYVSHQRLEGWAYPNGWGTPLEGWTCSSCRRHMPKIFGVVPVSIPLDAWICGPSRCRGPFFSGSGCHPGSGCEFSPCSLPTVFQPELGNNQLYPKIFPQQPLSHLEHMIHRSKERESTGHPSSAQSQLWPGAARQLFGENVAGGNLKRSEQAWCGDPFPSLMSQLGNTLQNKSVYSSNIKRIIWDWTLIALLSQICFFLLLKSKTHKRSIAIHRDRFRIRNHQYCCAKLHSNPCRIF